jgi:prevent-host-death family protein
MINITTDIRPVTDLRTDTADIMATVDKKQGPVIFTKNGRPAYIISVAKDYEGIAHDKYVAEMVRESDADIAAGRTYSMSKVHNELRRKFGA